MWVVKDGFRQPVGRALAAARYRDRQEYSWWRCGESWRPHYHNRPQSLQATTHRLLFVIVIRHLNDVSEGKAVREIASVFNVHPATIYRLAAI